MKLNRVVPAVAVLVVLALPVIIGACGGSGVRKAGPLRVVVATSIPGELAQRVAGSDAEVTVLLGANGDPHSFEPTTAQARAMADADVVLTVGLDFAPWLAKLTEASGTRATRVELAKGLPDLIPTGAGAGGADDHDDHGHDHGHDHDHDGHEHADDDHDHDHGHDDHDHGDHDHDHAHGPVDPHVWHDVTNAIHMVKAIRDALVAADAKLFDGAHAAGYKQRAEALIAELTELDGWVKAEVQKIPEAQRMLITGHDNMRYFARRYGFRVLGDLLGSTTTQGHSASMGKAKRVLELIREHKVRAVFTENTSVEGKSYLEGVARDAAVIAYRLFTDSLGDPSLDEPATYIELVRHNVKTLVTALGD